MKYIKKWRLFENTNLTWPQVRFIEDCLDGIDQEKKIMISEVDLSGNPVSEETLFMILNRISGGSTNQKAILDFFIDIPVRDYIVLSTLDLSLMDGDNFKKMIWWIKSKNDSFSAINAIKKVNPELYSKLLEMDLNMEDYSRAGDWGL